MPGTGGGMPGTGGGIPGTGGSIPGKGGGWGMEPLGGERGKLSTVCALPRDA